MTSQSRRIAPVIVGALLLVAHRVEAAPDDTSAAPATVAPVPVAPPASPDSTTSDDDAPNLVLPDDTHDEGHEDPIAKISELEARLDQMQALVANRQPRVIVGGYIDLGFFATEGNGSGIVRDQGNVYFPQYAGKYGWVFLGDILATPINTRGEPADLGDATGAVPRDDSIHSGGAPGFIVNEINMKLTYGLGPSAVATASLNFTPRTGSNFSLGNEYRERKSDQRYGITPSLIARYTTGTAIGVKVRSKFGPDDLLVLAGAVTNGSFTT